MKHYTVRMKFRVFVTAIAASLSLSAISSARKIEIWPYEKLLKEADLVVIARAVSKVATDDSDGFSGVETTFELAAVIKGKSANSFKVLHFQYKNPSRPFEDGPGLVSFFTEPLSVGIRRSGVTEEEGPKTLEPTKSKSLKPAPEYLLFLIRRADGRFEAVSGQVDPNSSVRTLVKKGI
jgi:hypothetical protein